MNNWTILIYANGNNELEPEVFKRFSELIGQDIDDSFNIIVQIARANPNLLDLLRPNIRHGSNQQWEGVRRYKIENGQALLLEDLGNVNMSDPSTFVAFVSWGIDNYSSTKTMVIISGHGAGFVGIMTDYLSNVPYMMDISGLTKSLYEIKTMTKKRIDCLVLDACYMNMVEVWNEIASISNKPVKYLLVPSQNIKIEGLSYKDIIDNIRTEISLQEALVETTKSINKLYKNENQLLLIKLKKRYFNKLKKEISHLGEHISHKGLNLREMLNKWSLSKVKDPLIGILDLVEIVDLKNSNRKKHMEGLLNKIVIFPKMSSLHLRLNQGPSLYLPFSKQEYSNLRKYYDPLNFSEDNNWLEVLGGLGNIPRFSNSKREKHILPPPLEIPIEYVIASVVEQNPDISEGELIKIINNMG